jgi:hypothetical protein
MVRRQLVRDHRGACQARLERFAESMMEQYRRE